MNIHPAEYMVDYGLIETRVVFELKKNVAKRYLNG